MYDIFSREPDPLDRLLAPPSPPPDADVLRQRVYARTRRVLRRRRFLRQLAYSAGLAASFAAGLLVMHVAMRPAPTLDVQAHSANKDEPQPPVSPPTPPAEAPALAQEWRAFDSSDQRGELYRRAGDRYLTEENDPLSALRCYTNALDNGSEQDRAISADDNWLLMAIKDARQKENKHAETGG